MHINIQQEHIMLYTSTSSQQSTAYIWPHASRNDQPPDHCYTSDATVLPGCGLCSRHFGGRALARGRTVAPLRVSSEAALETQSALARLQRCTCTCMRGGQGHRPPRSPLSPVRLAQRAARPPRGREPTWRRGERRRGASSAEARRSRQAAPAAGLGCGRLPWAER